MTTRREFIQQIPAAGAGFAVAGGVIFAEAQAYAQAPAPLDGHFHPQGKAPSKYTIEVLKQAKATLPFNDTRDLEEQKKGLIAPMKQMVIKSDRGGVAWDVELPVPAIAGRL
jgi:hypothetical protein